jgi:tRNA-dihydrouridine synthase B
MPKVTRNGEGCALMREPGVAAAVVEAAARATAKPVTVKIRAGWDAASVNAVEFARRMEAAGCAMVAVHARTREQMYAGRADWGLIARVKAAVRVPVVGNGDVACGADALRMARETCCDGVMIGRAAQGNPWIFREADAALRGGDAPVPPPPPPDLRERCRVMRRHLELALREKGERAAVLEMRKHLAWYVKGMRGASSMKNKAFQAGTAAQVLALIDWLEEGAAPEA